MVTGLHQFSPLITRSSSTYALSTYICMLHKLTYISRQFSLMNSSMRALSIYVCMYACIYSLIPRQFSPELLYTRILRANLKVCLCNLARIWLLPARNEDNQHDAQSQRMMPTLRHRSRLFVWDTQIRNAEDMITSMNTRTQSWMSTLRHRSRFFVRDTQIQNAEDNKSAWVLGVKSRLFLWILRFTSSTFYMADADPVTWEVYYLSECSGIEYLVYILLTCESVYTYVYTNTQEYKNTPVYTCVHVCIHTCIRTTHLQQHSVCMHISVCVCVHVCTDLLRVPLIAIFHMRDLSRPAEWMCVCVCVYVCIPCKMNVSVYVCVCMYAWTRKMNVCMCARVYVCMTLQNECIFVCVCVCMHDPAKWMYVCMYARFYVCMTPRNECMYVCTCIPTYIRMYSPLGSC